MVSGTTEDWKLLTVAVPCEGVQVQELLVHITATGTGVFYADDLKLNAVKPQEELDDNPVDPAFESAILRNASLEELNGDGTITHWDIWPGNQAEGERKFQIVSDAHTGTQAVRIDLHNGNKQAIYQYCVDTSAFDFNESYRASVWMKLKDLKTSELTLTVKRRDSNGNEHNISTALPTATTDGWVLFTLDAPKVKGATIVQYDVIVDIGAGSGSVYMDDFDLTPAELENLPNPNAEPEEKPKDNNGIDLTPVQPEEPAPVEQPQEKSGVPVWVIAVIAVGAVLLIGGIVLLVRKKKRG